jgi:hypothetical protein
MRWDRISLLIDDLTEDLLRDGYVLWKSSWTYFILPFSYFYLDSNYQDPVKWQLGVVRTNCMDNLDRTNVAQAAIARWTLDLQLKAAGILGKKALWTNMKRLMLLCGRVRRLVSPRHFLC